MAEVFDFGLQQHKIKMDGKFFENNLFAVAGDTGRRLELQLLDSDNLVQNTTGISLRLNANVAGQATYAEATLVDATKGLYELDLPNGMLIAPGNWQFQWQIIGVGGEKLHSFAFMGSIGSNLSEGGSEATNFYLNADELKQMQDDLINGTFNSEILETNIAEKLNNLEEQYAPKLAEVTAQFGTTTNKQINQSMWEDIDGRGLNIKTLFGAKGDGVTDDTQAFLNATKQASDMMESTVLASNRVGNMSINIPPGTYIVKDPILFDAEHRVLGLIFKGSGRYTTRIVYEPNDLNKPLITNNDKWLGLVFEDISFYGHKDADFMLSISNGGAQNYNFMRVTWNNWRRTVELQGTNNNSEMSWYHCNWNGEINVGLYIGNVNTSDQFLNYDFYSCNFEVQNGTFIEAWKGGNFRVYGGSIILQHVNADKPIFKLRNNEHWRGAEYLYNVGTRYEFREGNGLLIDSEWGAGNITFETINTITNDQTIEHLKKIRARFTTSNAGMSAIKFTNSNIGGKHEYVYGEASYQYMKTVIYENCTLHSVINNKNNLEDFIIMTPYGSHGNTGGIPVIDFNNCKGRGSELNTKIFTSYNAINKSNVGFTNKKIISVRPTNSRSFMSMNKKIIHLPNNSIVTNVRFYCPPNSTTVGGRTVDFRIQTTELTPTILGRADGMTLSTGFNLSLDLFHVCDTAEKRTLQIGDFHSQGLDRDTDKIYILIEYI